MKKNLLARLVVVSLLALAVPGPAGAAIPGTLPDPGTATVNTASPVKVYILSGQSNMVGMGQIAGTEPGTLETITSAGMFPHMVDGVGSWTVRDDVTYKGVITATGQGPLTPGVQGSTFGPEMQFGQVMGDFHGEPVLLLKVSQGNRSLAWDILPPGSERYTVNGITYAGYGDRDDQWSDTDPYTPIATWYAGKQYDDYVTATHDVLDNFGTTFPEYADRGYEIGGFVWWQGHKDSQNTVHASRYELNLVNFIKSFRSEFSVPAAPFVMATIGFGGWGMSGNYLTVANAQLAVSGETDNYPEFVDNVKTVESRDYWRTAAESPRNEGHHYNRNAETYMLVGDALGQAMSSLQFTRAFLTVDRQTGEIKIVNPADGDMDMDLEAYSITSAAGALDPTSWTTIAGNYDLAGDGSVDSDGNWTVLTGTNGELSEEAQLGGNDGLITIGAEVSLGVGAWVRNLTRDLRFTYTDTDGALQELSVRYVGTPIALGDLNFDGTVGGADWAIFLAGNQADLSALSAAEAYQMGDLDGDGDNDIYDFALFREAYELDNPAPGAFAEMLAAYSVPEPTSLMLLALGAAGLGMWRRRRARPGITHIGKIHSATFNRRNS